jgi:signal transduction histidine kinase
MDKLFALDGHIISRPGTANELGTGLGLILCSEFIQKMGGSISVKSKLGQGSRFNIHVPDKPADKG